MPGRSLMNTSISAITNKMTVRRNALLLCLSLLAISARTNSAPTEINAALQSANRTTSVIPIGDNRYVQREDLVITTTENTPTLPINNGFSNDEALDDEAFERFVERLANESKESVSQDAANYVSDDTDLDEIIRLIESQSSTESSLVEPTSTSGSISIPASQFNEGDYIDDHNQFQELLKKLEKDSREDIRTDPDNFAPDSISDQELGALVKRLAEEAESDNVCPICRDIYTQEMEIVKTECNHRFHSECLESWYGRSYNCPICRSDMHRKRNWKRNQPLVERRH